MVLEGIIDNPFYLAAGGLILVLGGVLYMKFFKGDGSGGGTSAIMPGGQKVARKSVFLLRPRDHRFMPVPVDIENARSIVCKKIDKVSRRFYKTGPGWTNPEKRETVFLAIDGLGYVCNINQPDAPHYSLKEVLTDLWTDEFYNKIPKPYKELVESTNYGLTIDVVIPTEEGLPFKSSEDLNEEDRQKMLHELANPEEKPSLVKTLMPILFGFFAGASVVLLINTFRGG